MFRHPYTEGGKIPKSLDSGLSQYGLEIVAGFDVREDLDGNMINGIPVFHMDDFPAKQKEYGAYNIRASLQKYKIKDIHQKRPRS